MTHNELSGTILEVAIDVHRRLGPGLLESVYQTILAHELTKQGLVVRKEEPVPLVWDDLHFDIGFRADLIVNDLVLVELKSVEQLAPVHKKQVLTYLRITGLKLGLGAVDQLRRRNPEIRCEADHQRHSRRAGLA